MTKFEFYETPHAFSNWLFERIDIRGRVFEPCVGNRAILWLIDKNGWRFSLKKL